jgi:alkylation response protein AidB-like acyl-CoA dehydrogenase
MFDGLQFNLAGWADGFVAEAKALADENRAELSRCARELVFPRDIFEEMGRRGWVGPFAPAEVGGLGGGIAEYCVIEEMVARTGLVSPQASIQGQRWLLDWATPEQTEKYLGPIARGSMVFSESISEPNTGSSLKSMSATARRDGGDWILNGVKTHVNLGLECDVTLFYGVAEEGLTAFLVDKEDGFTARHSNPLGLRLQPTADVFFEDVRVPGTAVLGEPGRGLDTFLGTFNISRLGNASELIGWGQRAMGEALTYAERRKVGANLVTEFQGIQWTVADIYSALYAASLARNHAATVADRDEDPALATSLAKKLAIEAAELATGECFALIGGHGLYHDTDYGALLHDVKTLRIAGGSLEVLRNYVARRVMNSPDRAGL